MKFLNLFIDESGQANPKFPNSRLYILSGCMVDKYSRDTLKIKADQIKFKYWGRTNIVFHSREIARKENNFAVLNNPKIQNSFEKDLFYFLKQGGYQTFFVAVDLKAAKSLNWNEDKVFRETSLAMVENFILALLAGKNSRGRIIVESATAKKDFYFHKAASFYLSGGIPKLKVDYSTIQKLLTEISFVTKKNYDIEEQIADLLAYGAKLKFLKKKPASDYEAKILKVVELKLFKMHPKTGVKKKKFYSKINSFKKFP